MEWVTSGLMFPSAHADPHQKTTKRQTDFQIGTHCNPSIFLARHLPSSFLVNNNHPYKHPLCRLALKRAKTHSDGCCPAQLWLHMSTKGTNATASWPPKHRETTCVIVKLLVTTMRQFPHLVLFTHVHIEYKLLHMTITRTPLPVHILECAKKDNGHHRDEPHRDILKHYAVFSPPILSTGHASKVMP
jgi:hypothetical protein